MVGAVGEERLGSPGAVQVATWPAPDFCIIGEPSGWDAVCLGYRGTLAVHLPALPAGPSFGRAGRNGRRNGDRVLERADGGDRRTQRGRREFICSPGPSLRAFNTTVTALTDDASCRSVSALPPGVDVHELAGRIRELAGSAEITIEGRQEGYRPISGRRSRPPFLRNIRAQGGQPRFTLKLGTSDMTVVGPVWQCPAVAYGPGDASLDHTPEERIVLDDYLRAVRVLTEVLEAL